MSEETISVPVMVTEPEQDEGVIHWVGRDRETGEYVTACGKEATYWPAILAYKPTCEDCLAVLKEKE